MATCKQCIYMYVKVFESNWNDLVHSSRPLHVIIIFFVFSALGYSDVASVNSRCQVRIC